VPFSVRSYAVGELADTWRWTGTDWEELHPVDSPGPLDPGLAYSAGLGVVVLFGGFDGVAWQNETWTFDGSNWTQLLPPIRPEVRAGHAMASFGSRVVVFGGFANNVYHAHPWTFNGTRWSRGPSGHVIPSARSALGLTLDPVRQELVMFGGRNLNQATYFGETWTLGA
jgi:hypothetical protein